MTATLPTSGSDTVEVREVDAARWPDFELLFESRGGPKWCWCRMWRRDANGRMPHDPVHMKESMRQRIAGGGRVGLLVYVDGGPAAWCSVVPRETFVDLGGVEEPDEDSAAVWSLRSRSCMAASSASLRGMCRTRMGASLPDGRRDRARGACAARAWGRV